MKMKKLNKRGAEMAIGTLVIIVLAIIVLVVLALGFGTGWSNLWNRMTGYFSPVNVDSVKQACAYACTSSASYDYCCLKRDVTIQGADGKKDSTKYKGKDKALTCEGYVSELGFEPCDEFTCNPDLCPSSASSGNSQTPMFDSRKVLDECNAELEKARTPRDITAPIQSTVDPDRVIRICDTSKTYTLTHSDGTTEDITETCKQLNAGLPQKQVGNQILDEIVCP